jgi:hypothetical protein
LNDGVDVLPYIASSGIVVSSSEIVTASWKRGFAVSFGQLEDHPSTLQQQNFFSEQHILLKINQNPKNNNNNVSNHYHPSPPSATACGPTRASTAS